MRSPAAAVLFLGAIGSIVAACHGTPLQPGTDAPAPERTALPLKPWVPTTPSGASAASGQPTGDAGVDAQIAQLLQDAGADGSLATATGDDDPMSNHHDVREELLQLFDIKALSDKEKRVILPEQFLSSVFGVDGPAHANQGNKERAEHLISKKKCQAGLKDVVLQTPEQKAACGGAENMVPINFAGKPPYLCMDIFEFPNKACELPVVWIPPTYAKKVCELQGKRLCSQVEWNQACRGDPGGAPDTKYAYGDELDLTICHSNKPPRSACDPTSARNAWNSCNTDSEPSGSFPKCKSRFGVYDQHGNVAEIMMRRDTDGKVVTQLKGSAWFYVNVAREPGKPSTKPKNVETYPDHCNFDPRWHVEPIDNAWHVNYHLGFRCCKSVP